MMEIVNEINGILEEIGSSTHLHSIEHLIHSLPMILVTVYESYFHSTPEGIICNPTNTLEEMKNIEVTLTALKNYNKSRITAKSLLSGDVEALRGLVEIFSLISRSLLKPTKISPSSFSNEMNELDLILEKIKLLDERLNFEISQTQGFLDLRSEALRLKILETNQLLEAQEFQINNLNGFEKDSFGTPCKVIPHQGKPRRKMKKKPKEIDSKPLEMEPNETQTNNVQSIIPSRPSSGAPSKRKPMVRKMLTKNVNHTDKPRPGSAPTQKSSSRKDNQSSSNQNSRQRNDFSVSENLEKYRLPILHKNDTQVSKSYSYFLFMLSRNTRTTNGLEER